MNWGYRILLTFILGAAFILFLVVRSFGVQTEMVEDNYYVKELAYNHQIEATANLSHDPEALTLKQDGKNVTLRLDTSLSKYITSGTLHFYYPSSAKSDRKMDLKASQDGIYTISTSGWKKGNLTAKVSFVSGGSPYYKEFNIFR